MGRLSTHVLDTSAGAPAQGISVTLLRLEGGARQEIGTFVTNSDGRTDGPLLSGDAVVPGVYELVFDVAAYFRGTPTFYETIPIRFRVADPAGHYHVPLVLTPWAYSTYRGS